MLKTSVASGGGGREAARSGGDESAVPYALAQDVKAAVECEEAKVLRADGDGPEEVEGGNLGRQAGNADDTVVSHR